MPGRSTQCLDGMNEQFAKLIESLHPSLTALLSMDPYTSGTLPRSAPRSGIYLFSEGSTHLYVGRSNRLPERVRNHGKATSRQNVASFAFLIARRETGNLEAAYTPAGSRDALLADPTFAAAFVAAKYRIGRMSLRYVEERDQLRQALLEMYVHVALETPFNDFDTH